MTQTVAQPRKTLGVRLGTNPKTLHRKALEKAAAAPKPEGESLEDMFPASPADDNSEASASAAKPQGGDPIPADAPAATAIPTNASVPVAGDTKPAIATVGDQPFPPPSIPVDDQAPSAAPERPAVTPSWSDADERSYQGLLARRKAAGFQRRGRDVSAQRVRAGQIKPNVGTVMSAIVAIVAGKGVMTRGELVDLMAVETFAHPKARPTDRGWCTAYAQGAIRDGFLQLIDEATASGESSPETAS